MKHLPALSLLFALLLRPASLAGQLDATTLFSEDGEPDVYISFTEDVPTIYLWSGKPVAYLVQSIDGGFHVYGFQGKHLGWYVSGIIRDHEGRPVCGVARVVSDPKPEPQKSAKQPLPQKSGKQAPPHRPLYKRPWSPTPCATYLSQEPTQ